MEDGIVGFMFGCLLAALAGVICYASAQDTMKQRAIDAGVACYYAKNDGRAEFKFNCDKEKK